MAVIAIATVGVEPTPKTTTERLPDDLRAKLDAALADGSVELPVVDGLMAEVLGMAQSATADAAKLSGLIHRDPSLAGQILRIANSPLYRPRSPIVSLQQAIARLGLQAITEIAIGLSAREKLFRAPGYDDIVRAVWRHSAVAAAFAKEIARARRYNVESAFLCALMHDVGRPLLLKTIIELARRDKIAVSRDAILSSLDEMHEATGKLLAQKWSLPDAVVASIGEHHAHAPSAAHHDSVRMTQLADELAHFAVAEGEPNDEAVRNAPAVAELNLYPEAVDALIAFKDRAIAFADVLS